MNDLIPKELEAFLSAFRQTLSESDRAALDDLLRKTQELHAAIRNSAHPLPYQAALLALLIEEHKEVGRLRRLVEEYNMKILQSGES